MTKRLLVQINAEQLANIERVKALRQDLAAYPNSKIVHLLLQERMARLLNKEEIIPRKDEAWLEYIREKIPLALFSPIALGVVRRSQEMIGKGFTKILVSVESDKILWCNYREDLENVGAFLIENLKGEFTRDYCAKHERLYAELVPYCEKLLAEKLDERSDEELARLYEEAYERCLKLHGLTFDIDAIDHHLEKKMKERVQQHLEGKEASQAYTLLTTPLEQSYVAEEEEATVALAERIRKEQPEILQYDTEIILQRLKPTLSKELSRLAQRYWWTDLGWISGEEKRPRDFIETIKRGGERQARKVTPGDKKKLLEELKDERLAHYVQIFERYARFHDYRKEMQMKSNHLLKHILLDISRRKNVKYEDLLWCWPEEIKECATAGKPPKGLQRRQADYLVLVTEKSVEEHYGEGAKRVRQQELSETRMHISNFQGVSASKGKAIGKAKICYSATEAMAKIQEGDILVTSMTMPDYLPAMKKAKAIVTNEGGITCHAAIVSRELSIPCLVGTRIATKALEDGDLVEVNADHGVVKILERK